MKQFIQDTEILYSFTSNRRTQSRLLGTEAALPQPVKQLVNEASE